MKSCGVTRWLSYAAAFLIIGFFDYCLFGYASIFGENQKYRSQNLPWKLAMPLYIHRIFEI